MVPAVCIRACFLYMDINKFMRVSLGVFACYETGKNYENKLCDGWADKELHSLKLRLRYFCHALERV